MDFWYGFGSGSRSRFLDGRSGVENPPNRMPRLQKQRKRNQQARRRPTQQPPGKASRLSIAWVVVSSLIVCSLLAAGVFTAAQLDFFGLGEDDPDLAENYEDPNDDVIAAQQTAVAENPDDFNALVLLANLLGNTGRLTEAIPVYEKAVAMRPDDAATRLDFARALSDGDMRADAEVQFLKVIELDPNNQAAYYYLAEMYRTSTPARTEEAIPLYQRAIEIDSGTFLAEQSGNQLASLGQPNPMASPAASPAAGGNT
jgi:cytochrome c-type biogenesis protein CcmH/NrfG